jgi:hypothetical protein
VGVLTTEPGSRHSHYLHTWLQIGVKPGLTLELCGRCEEKYSISCSPLSDGVPKHAAGLTCEQARPDPLTFWSPSSSSRCFRSCPSASCQCWELFEEGRWRWHRPEAGRVINGVVAVGPLIELGFWGFTRRWWWTVELSPDVGSSNTSRLG